MTKKDNECYDKECHDENCTNPEHYNYDCFDPECHDEHCELEKHYNRKILQKKQKKSAVCEDLCNHDTTGTDRYFKY